MSIKFINRKDALSATLILAAVFLSYFNALSNGFVYDDKLLVEFNYNIRSLGNIPTLFSTGYWTDQLAGAGLYRPVTMLSFLAEYTIAGTSPLIYHLDNILLHFLCSVLVYMIMKSLVQDSLAPVFAAVLFAAHPVHTEAVAWVSGRAELLATLFTLLAFWIFVRRPLKSGNTALSCAAFFIALMSKETAAVLPVLLAAYILLFDKADRLAGRLKRILALYPYLTLFIIYMVIRFSVIGVLGPSGKYAALLNFSRYEAFLIMTEAFYHYLRLSFFPLVLSEDYYYKPVESLFNYKVVIPILAAGSAVLFAKRIIRYSRPLYLGVVWFFIALLPVSNIIPTGIFMSDRALYLPSVGICMLLGIMLSGAYSYGARKSWGWAGPAVIAAVVAITALFAVRAIYRNPVWGDQFKFEERLIETSKKRVAIYPFYPNYLLLADAYVRHGYMGPEAEEAALNAVRLDEGSSNAHYYLSVIYLNGGRLQGALDEAEKSLRLKKTGKTFTVLGTIYYMLGRYAESDEMHIEAIKLEPANGQYYLNRGYTRLQLKDPDTALWLFDTAGRIDPSLVYAFIEQGKLLLARQDYAHAVEKLELAVRTAPDNPDAHYELAVAYMGSGRQELANRELDETLRIAPGHADALRLRGGLR